MINLTTVKKSKEAAVLPYFDKNSWLPPKDFPNIPSTATIAIDTETYDPELLSAGPGWGRAVGHIVGVSLACEGGKWYFPIAHEVQSEANLDREKVYRFLRHVLSFDRPKVFANASYDLGWLSQEGVEVNGPCWDVLVAERLLDFNQFKVNLESVSQKYLGVGKDTPDLYKWLASAYGGKPDSKQRANMYRSPVSLAGPYAEEDAALPLQIIQKQMQLLSENNLMTVFDLETRLIPLLMVMRKRGVRISEGQAEYANKKLTQEIDRVQHQLNAESGFYVNVNSAKDLEKVFTKANVKINRTAKGNPSFTKDWLKACPAPQAKKVGKIRSLTKTVSTFIQGAILDKQVNGRIHGQFNPMGAGTGRFSSSNPNLQNIPARDPELGPMMRSIFIPEPGMDWMKADYSSVEYRFFAHFSRSKALIKAYNDDPNVDFHNVVKTMIGGDLPRVAYKTLSFSRMYGGGIATITKQMNLNFTLEEQIHIITTLGAKVLSKPGEQLAQLIMNLYDEKFPAVSRALGKASEQAELTGCIRTVLGRRISYDMFEPVRGKGVSLPYHKAVSMYGAANIRRAKTYKALNAFNQGSSADAIKKAMVDCFEAGLFNQDRLNVPHLTVHDELDNSVHPDLRSDMLEMRQIMETSVKLSVPLVVDMDVGPNWGTVKSVDVKNYFSRKG